MQAGTCFPKERRMLLFHAPLNLARCFAATLLLPLCLLLRPILKFWSVGAALMRFTWAIISERKILVSNFSMTRNNLCEFHTLDWFPHVCVLPENRLRRRHVLKYTTQLPCIRLLTFGRLALSRFSRSIVTLVSNKSSFLSIIILQYSHCTFVIIRFGPFCRLFLNLTNEHFSPKRQPFLFLYNKHSGGCHFSQNELLQIPPR